MCGAIPTLPAGTTVDMMCVLPGLGGVWLPLEVTGEAFQTVGHLLPTAWAMDGIQNIIVRGLGSVLLPAGIMPAYEMVLFVSGVAVRVAF